MFDFILDKTDFIAQLVNNIIYQMLISLSDMVISQAYFILIFMFSLINEMSTALIYSDVAIVLYGLFKICAFGFAFMGIAFALQDYVNVLDNSNSEYLNLNPKDYLLPAFVSLIFAGFYIDVTLFIFKELSRLNIQLLQMISITDNLDHLDTFLPNGIDALFLVIIHDVVCFMFLIAAVSLLKQQLTKAPIILINMISGVLMTFSIARGETGLVFQYAKSVFGIAVPMIVKSFLLVWGTKYMYSNPLIGFGLIICSFQAEQILRNFAFTISTKTGYSNAMKTISGVLGSAGRMVS